MCNMEGWNVIYGNGYATIEPHFCRVYGDCGSNLDFNKACEMVADWYIEQGNQWKKKTHPEAKYYLDNWLSES